jgi:cell division protease FtsH
MVMQWGMSDKLGMVQYGDDQEYVFLGRDMAQRKDYSEFTAQEIDAEVKRIINEAYKAPRIDRTPTATSWKSSPTPARIRNARRRAGRGPDR